MPVIRPTALALAIAFSGCTIASSHRVPDGAQTARGYRSVAGEVRVGRNAIIHGARTVAGDIEVGDRASTHSLNATAGDIRVGESVRIQGDVQTVAGEIRIGRGSHVSGEISSVAGNITLAGCHVDGLVHATRGSLRVRDATRLTGGVIVHHTSFGQDSDPAEIDIGPGAEVSSIKVEPGALVEVRISREATVGEVTGATATYY